MPAVRAFAIAAVASLALCAAGCAASNNKGRVEGRWKIVSEASILRDTFLTFGDDGIVTLERPAEGAGKRSNPIAWRYKLLAGDAADFYDLPPDATDRAGLFPALNGLVRATIRIESMTGGKYEEREMILTTGEGQTLRLTWMR